MIYISIYIGIAAIFSIILLLFALWLMGPKAFYDVAFIAVLGIVWPMLVLFVFGAIILTVYLYLFGGTFNESTKTIKSGEFAGED